MPPKEVLLEVALMPAGRTAGLNERACASCNSLNRSLASPSNFFEEGRSGPLEEIYLRGVRGGFILLLGPRGLIIILAFHIGSWERNKAVLGKFAMGDCCRGVLFRGKCVKGRVGYLVLMPSEGKCVK